MLLSIPTTSRYVDGASRDDPTARAWVGRWLLGLLWYCNPAGDWVFCIIEMQRGCSMVLASLAFLTSSWDTWTNFRPTTYTFPPHMHMYPHQCWLLWPRKGLTSSGTILQYLKFAVLSILIVEWLMYRIIIFNHVSNRLRNLKLEAPLVDSAPLWMLMLFWTSYIISCWTAEDNLVSYI